ncbi:GAF domain-containing protein [Kineococcus xinjiangensis]|uniref:GAF domain-containing protein n=1 Tax=Kineococcus xinjiangensis TaxID=512762 RepID=A0A2S6IIX4_9ACTN|nr:GAF domain-containing protein [Kineococcus xinjiangensis]PPK94173.1 GAF domain-containing protein [Kineococcus xinjiangensis]
MSEAPRPVDPVQDVERLTEIGRFDLFSDEARARLDGFARRAAERLGLPIGLVNIVLYDAQHMAGSHGLTGWLAETRGTPVEWSFCATSVRTGEEYVVPDAQLDEAQCDNPLVTIDGIRSYAGVPLITSAGHVLGSCCVLGTEVHEFTATEVAELRAMAAEVVAEIESLRLPQVVAS